jgi:hypothetical protein
MGSIASMGLNPQKARVLQMLGLTKTSDAGLRLRHVPAGYYMGTVPNSFHKINGHRP